MSGTSDGFKTPQESFWAGPFGSDYIARNEGSGLLAANLAFFARALARAGRIESCVEFGANIGLNLRALKLLFPGIRQLGIEINADAAKVLGEAIGPQNVFAGSILDYPADTPSDLALTKGVLIHIDPASLPTVYGKLYESTCRHLLLCEYYSPSPVVIPYRGHAERLFKRDFAGEMLDAFPALRLVDYGFVYRRDTAFPQDDITWFLLEKGNGQK